MPLWGNIDYLSGNNKPKFANTTNTWSKSTIHGDGYTANTDTYYGVMFGVSTTEKNASTEGAKVVHPGWEAGGTPVSATPAPIIEAAELQTAKLHPPPVENRATVDPVTAVKRAVQSMRRISLEKISQDSGVSMLNVTKILGDLLDGRELSGRIDHDAGDFILGTGTGPSPKTIHGCPYCRTELERVAVKGETVTCSVCRESFIVS